MQGTAIYRLPYGNECTLIEGDISEWDSCAELNGRNGFVIAPFQITSQQPILLIRPDHVQRFETSASDNIPEVFGQDLPAGLVWKQENPPQRIHYSIDFANFHAQLQEGMFDKIVLARCAVEPRDGKWTPVQLFRKACRLYPRLFVALVTTPQSGTWLMATPEILLEGSGTDWRTVALAGTMRLEGEQLSFDSPPSPVRTDTMDVRWSTKNIQEQRLVATYVIECLEQFMVGQGSQGARTGVFREEGPRTVRAANLVHLRSDFAFTLPDNEHLGDVLYALHPTPAVCGLPKRTAFNFIIQNEHTPRRYYSGFMGPLGIDSQGQDSEVRPETHLYVSLRCMNIARDTYYLYAGGGLMKDSTETQEWLETEAKLETMRMLLKDNLV